MNEQNILEVRNITKKYRIYHVKHTTLFETIISKFKSEKTYETLNALDNVTFNAKPGELIALIGRNGCGKTTLLKIISRIIPPTKGTIKISKKIVPFLSLGSGFHYELTGRENVKLFSAIMGLDKKTTKKNLEEIFTFAGVKKFQDTKLKYYSSGMVSRLAFSTMIKADFDVMLLDEIFAVGDKEFKNKCIDKMLEFKKKGKTIILATHDTDTVKKFADRAILLEKGKIISTGKPAKVIEDYFK